VQGNRACLAVSQFHLELRLGRAMRDRLTGKVEIKVQRRVVET
jgi:hypothetical protein